MGRFIKWVVSLLIFGSLTSPVFSQESEFALIKEVDSIFIYERWVTFPGSDPPQQAREVMGEFTATSTFDEVLNLLKSPKWIMKCQKHVSEFKVYPSSFDTLWHEYSYHDIPWPVSDQDHFLVYTIEHSSQDELFLSFESTADYTRAPVRDGVDRMNLYGSWTLKKLDNNKIQATYRIISEPSNIPRIFTDPIIRRNIVVTIQSMIEILEEEEL